MDNFRLRAQSQPWQSGISFALFDNTGPKRVEITFTKVDDGQMVSPFTTIDMQSAQLLMDDLWHCGLRPSDGVGSVGELRAVKEHLSDMRKIASNKLKIAF